MMDKSSKKNTLVDTVIRRTSSKLDYIALKFMLTKKVIDRWKQRKTLNEVKQVENIKKNCPSFQKKSSVQKEAHPSHKLQYHAYQQQNPFRLQEDNTKQKNCQHQFQVLSELKFFSINFCYTVAYHKLLLTAAKASYYNINCSPFLLKVQ